MKPAPILSTMLPGNVIVLIMLVTLSLDVYRTFFQKQNDKAKGLG